VGTDGHGHDHHDDVDWAAMAAYLSAWDDVAEPVNRAIVEWLGVGDGDIVVDVGSGAGGMTALFAEAVGPTGTVIAVDGEPVLLEVARGRAERPDRHVATVPADLEQQRLGDVLPHPAVDLVHASAVVHHFDDELRAIRDLASVVRPGGHVVLVEGGLGTRFLPADCGIGEPGLEQRLAAAQEAWFWSEVRPAAATVRTGRGWGSLLGEAGLVDVAARTFLLDVPPPLDEPTRRLVRDALAGQAVRFGDRIDESDRETLHRLLDDDDPRGVMRRPDVYVLRASTVHVGTVDG
jgi:ubiquinone/menaquinone biosynthesis C-methylase UbiE